MLRTNNVFDNIEIKNTCNNYAITDSIADKVLDRIDKTIDAISAFQNELDTLIADLANSEENFTNQEITAIQLSMVKIFKRAIYFKFETILK